MEKTNSTKTDLLLQPSIMKFGKNPFNKPTVQIEE